MVRNHFAIASGPGRRSNRDPGVKPAILTTFCGNPTRKRSQEDKDKCAMSRTSTTSVEPRTGMYFQRKVIPAKCLRSRRRWAGIQGLVIPANAGIQGNWHPCLMDYIPDFNELSRAAHYDTGNNDCFEPVFVPSLPDPYPRRHSVQLLLFRLRVIVQIFYFHCIGCKTSTKSEAAGKRAVQFDSDLGNGQGCSVNL